MQKKTRQRRQAKQCGWIKSSKSTFVKEILQRLMKVHPCKGKDRNHKCRTNKQNKRKQNQRQISLSQRDTSPNHKPKDNTIQNTKKSHTHLEPSQGSSKKESRDQIQTNRVLVNGAQQMPQSTIKRTIFWPDLIIYLKTKRQAIQRSQVP